MKKIILSLLKSEAKKEARIPLILITIVITCMTIFASMNVVNLIKQSMEQDIRGSKVGTSDYVLYDKKFNAFKEIKIEDSSSLGVFSSNGLVTYKDKELKCDFWGVDLSKFQDVFGNVIENQCALSKDFVKDEIIINKNVSEKLGISDNDTVKIKISGLEIEFKVLCINENNNFLNSNESIVLVPREVLTDKLKIESDYVTSQYIYNSSISKEELISKVDNEDMVTEKSISNEMINSNLKSYYGVLGIIFVIILCSSYDILESANRIFIIQRCNYIGTLRSIGMTKKKIKRIFSGFALGIALIGSILGTALGEVCINLYNTYILKLDKLNQSPEDFLITAVITIAIGIAITIYSTISPLNNILKKSDKEILLNSTSVYVDNTLKPINYISLVVLIGLLIILNTMEIKSNMFLVSALVLAFIALLNILKVLYWAINKLLSSKPERGVFFISIKNTINNFFVRKTISTTITISLFLLLICTLAFSTLKGLSSFYYDYYADAFLRVDDSFLEEDRDVIKNCDSIKDYYFYNSSELLFNDDKKIAILSVDDPMRLEKNFINLKIKWTEGFNNEDFNNDFNIVITKILADRYSLALGDKVECSDGDLSNKYNIVGIADTLQELGDISFISKYESVKKDNGVYLISNSDKNMDNELSSKLTCTNYKYKSIDEMIEKDEKNSKQLFMLFYAFAIFIAISNLVGIYSNYKLSYIFRRKELATMYSYGYRISSLTKMIIYEVLFSSMIGFVYALGSTFIIVNILEKVMKSIEIPIPLTYSKETIIVLFVIIFCVSIINLFLAVGYVGKSKKKLIENLKS